MAGSFRGEAEMFWVSSYYCGLASMRHIARLSEGANVI